MALSRPCVCMVTDRRQVESGARTVDREIAELERLLDAAIEAGVDLIQIRETDLPAVRQMALVGRVIRRAHGTRTRIVVNDRADVACATGAAGVHLRADGPPTARVTGLGLDLVGRSVHRSSEAVAAAAADYLVFGTVFASMSKPGRLAAGLAELGGVVASTEVPVLAIGGVTPENAGACLAAGAAGVAGIGVFLAERSGGRGLGPARAVAALRAAMMLE